MVTSIRLKAEAETRKSKVILRLQTRLIGQLSTPLPTGDKANNGGGKICICLAIIRCGHSTVFSATWTYGSDTITIFTMSPTKTNGMLCHGILI